MNPNLARLHPYPFEKLRQLFAGVTPNPRLHEIRLSIGEPQHATPTFIKEALTAGLGGLSNYPTTLGIPGLRRAIADWLERRYALADIDPETQVIPINGSREALFAFAQTVIDPSASLALGGAPLVVSPNPFYQIYEGAAYLAGGDLRFPGKRLILTTGKSSSPSPTAMVSSLRQTSVTRKSSLTRPSHRSEVCRPHGSSVEILTGW